MKLKDLKFVFIEAGHGGVNKGITDNGAVGNGTTERAHTVDIARAAVWFMSQVAEFKHIRVIPVGVDEGLTLQQKIFKINNTAKRMGATAANSILVSIHVNSGGKGIASGVEGWFYTGSPESSSLVDFIAKCQSELIGLKVRNSRGDQSNRWGRLAIIRDTIPLACLIECGFIDNPSDAGLLKNPETEKKFGQGIIRGIKRFVGILT